MGRLRWSQGWESSRGDDADNDDDDDDDEEEEEEDDDDDECYCNYIYIVFLQKNRCSTFTIV